MAVLSDFRGIFIVFEECCDLFPKSSESVIFHLLAQANPVCNSRGWCADFDRALPFLCFSSPALPMRYLASLFALFALAFTLALAEPIPRAAPGAAAGELVGRRERMFGRPAGVLERDDPKRGQAGGRAGGASNDDSADATTNYVSLLSSSAATSATSLCFGNRDEGLPARGQAPDGAEWGFLGRVIGPVNLLRRLWAGSLT